MNKMNKINKMNFMNTMQLIKKGLTAFQVKIIALVIMTVDHLALYKILTTSKEINSLMRMAGRIAAPLFLFLLIESLTHTRSKKKYIMRLYIFGVIIQFVNELFKQVLFADYSVQLGNILPTFMYAAFYIICIEMWISAVKNSKVSQLILSATIMLIPFAVSLTYLYIDHEIMTYIKIFAPDIFVLEYSFGFALIGIFWYFCKNKIYNCLVFWGLSVLSYFIDVAYMRDMMKYIHFNFYHLVTPTQWGMMFAIPFILLYNGKKGKHGLKYLFYIYYPLHQYLLVTLSLFVLKR